MSAVTDANAGSTAPRCRFCASELRVTFVDLGMSPLCQTHIEPDRLDGMESFYPLHVRVCEKCFLVQLPEHVAPRDIFSDYAYFSSYSDSWIEHGRRYTELVCARFQLDAHSFVIEIASNDGYLLQHFNARGIPCLGIEPAANVAEAARQRGIRTAVRFFGLETARAIAEEFGRPRLLIGNNVLAHVPDINDFVSGLRALLAPGGLITLEFPHLLRLIEGNQFDTIYHEHYSYLSLGTVRQIFARHGLTLFDVEELPTHGGSLRIYACDADEPRHRETGAVARLLEAESAFGLHEMSVYREFDARVQQTKRNLLGFLIAARNEGRTIVGYGAPGKGNTLLNYCGIRSDFLDYTVDRNPHKQGRFTPGTHIPIVAPERIRETRPDYVLILPWNLTREITEQHAYIGEWGGRFVVPIPTVTVLERPAGTERRSG